MTSTLTARVGRGRHRLGRPGLVHVTTLIHVVHRGLFLSWRQPGRHRRFVAQQPVPTRTRVPAPAL